MRSAVLPLLAAIVALGACQAQEIQTQLSAITNGFPMASGATSSAAGQVQQELSQTMAKVNANIEEGMKSLLEPLIKFMVETGPNMGHLYWLIQGCPVRREFIEVGKDMWGQGAVKMAQLMGRGAVAGSDLAKGAMEWSGNALNGVNGATNTAAKTGIEMAYKMADAAMNLEMKKLDMLSDALKLVEKRLQDAGPRMKEFANYIQEYLKGVEGKINQSMEDVKQTMTKVISDGVKIMKDGSQRFQTEAQAYFYNFLTNSLNYLEKLREYLETINNKIKAIENNSSVDLSNNIGLTTGTNIESAAKMGSVLNGNDYLSASDILSAAMENAVTGTAGDLNV